MHLLTFWIRLIRKLAFGALSFAFIHLKSLFG
jgi:hypothetical protein